MKPLKLVIEGIKSFSNRIEIDFDKVSKGGLFGIFGNTGSGKSAILDSIIIALYGDLNGSKMADIINARKNSAFVSLDFEICEKTVRKRYLVERTFKLKKDGTYSGADASLYETTSGVAVMMAHQVSAVGKEIESIIGLGQSEFTKCIILPQGEFSQFVKTTKSERAKIIEKLFSLERFGERFNAKLKNELSSLSGQINSKNDTLSQIAPVTKEDVETATRAKEQLENEYKIENKKLLKITEYIEKNQVYYTLYDQLLKHRATFEKMQSEKPIIESYKKTISLYEKAKKIVEIGSQIKGSKKQLNDYLTHYSDLKYEFEKIKSQKIEIECEYAKYPRLVDERRLAESKKEDFEKMQEDYNKHKFLIAKIAERKSKIADYNAKIDELNKEIATFTSKIDGLMVERKQLEINTSVEKIFSFVSNSVIKEEYLRQIRYYTEQISRLREFNEDTPLYKYVMSEAKCQLSFYKEKNESITISENESVDSSIENYQRHQDKLKELDQIISKANAENVGLITKLNGFAESVKDEEVLLENDQNGLNEVDGKLLKIVENINDFEKEYESLRFQYKNLDLKIKNLIEANTSILKTYLESSNEISEVETRVNSCKTLIEKQEADLSPLFDSDLPNYEAAVEVTKSVVDFKTLNDKIAKFDSDFNYYKVSIDNNEKELESVRFSHEEYLENLKNQQEKQKSVHEIDKNLLEIKKSIEILSQNFEKRCIIEKDISTLSARASVFERLEKVVERRAFSEYIAYEFLNDIANQARKTLLELTNGKYDVVYKDSVESGKIGFYVLDNGNGGIERAVSTLSGGETFLVSLSLALALSASIYAGSDRPMEFFFLDEGFGTLDAELVDTVLDSLEKLRNKNFSIGLISHLSEMKSRIDRKILVTPDDGINGSSIKIII